MRIIAVFLHDFYDPSQLMKLKRRHPDKRKQQKKLSVVTFLEQFKFQSYMRDVNKYYFCDVVR